MSTFNSYSYAMYILIFLAVPSAIMIAILPTPQMESVDIKENNSHFPPKLTFVMAASNYLIRPSSVLVMRTKEISNIRSNKSTPNPSVPSSKFPSIPATPLTPTNNSWFGIETSVLQIAKKYSFSDMHMNLEMNKISEMDHKMQIIKENADDMTLPKINVAVDFNSKQVQKKKIQTFDLLAMCLVCMYQAQNVPFCAYATSYSMDFVGSSQKGGFYLLTSIFAGIATGRCASIYMFHKFHSGNIILIDSIGMFCNGLLFEMLHYLYSNKILTVT
eukprot:125386_1